MLIAARMAATASRDLVDLAFMAERWNRTELSEGLAIAIDAYGESILHELRVALTRFNDKSHHRRCLELLAVNDLRKLDRGLKALLTLLAK